MRSVPVIPLIHAYADILSVKLRNFLAVLAVCIGLFPDCVRYLLHVCHKPSPVPVLTVEVLTYQVHAFRAVRKHHPVPVTQFANGYELDIRINVSHSIRESVVLFDEIIR